MRRVSREAGNVAVITALVMTALLGAGALAVDLGGALALDARLQSQVDAATVAVAVACAENVVHGTPSCSTSAASGYLGGMTSTSTSLSTGAHGGRGGRVSITGGSTQPASAFAVTLFRDTGLEIQGTARATAAWGPRLTYDAVFPLAICKGPSLTPDTPFQLVIDPTSPSVQCDGVASPIEPFGWVPVDDTTECTTRIDLIAGTWLPTDDADDPPSVGNCDTQIDALLASVANGDPADDRTRILAISDRGVGGPSAGDAYALVAFEFNGLKFDDEDVTLPADPWDATCAAVDVQCIRGHVREWLPTDDGPIAEPGLSGYPGLSETTVLDVRLVE